MRRLASEQKRFDHVVMNLPATAIEFLDVFQGLLSDSERRSHKSALENSGTTSAVSTRGWWEGSMPLVHCYCFTTSSNPKRDVLGRVAHALGLGEDNIGALLEGGAHVHEVRDVAPHKWMMCAEFRIPRSVMFADSGTSTSDRVAKRRRVGGGLDDQ